LKNKGYVAGELERGQIKNLVLLYGHCCSMADARRCSFEKSISLSVPAPFLSHPIIIVSHVLEVDDVMMMCRVDVVGQRYLLTNRLDALATKNGFSVRKIIVHAIIGFRAVHFVAFINSLKLESKNTCDRDSIYQIQLP
jgi:hypothetical protein